MNFSACYILKYHLTKYKFVPLKNYYNFDYIIIENSRKFVLHYDNCLPYLNNLRGKNNFFQKYKIQSQ